MKKQIDFKVIIDKVRGSISPDIQLKKSLYTYSIIQNDKKSIHLQLKIIANLDGILFVDLTDVLHLNRSATLIFKLILDKKSAHFAYTYIRRRNFVENNRELLREISLISDFYIHLANGHSDCYVCSYIDQFKKLPMFFAKISAPYKIDLALTYGCNNACSHCYNEKGRLAMPSLRKSDWYKVIDKLVYEGVPHLILTGGEATLHPDLPEIIEYANKKGMVVGLNTNGRRLADDKYMNLLKEKGLNHIQFTLGSHIPEVHNHMMNAKSFEQTVSGIRNALDSGIHVITNSTIIQQNKNDLKKLIEFLYELGIRTFAMNGLIYSGGGTDMGEAISEDEMEIILEDVRVISNELKMNFLWYSPTEYCKINPVQLDAGMKRCNAGEYSLCIEPNGNILPCQSYYYATGNLLKDKWEDIWNYPLNSSFRDRELDKSGEFLPEYCIGCPAVEVCGGGCKIERDSALEIEDFDSLIVNLDTHLEGEEGVFYPSKRMVKPERASGVEKRIY
jgi:radical SAM protein with 4Fe4S-binding SPASM domain